MLLDLPVVIIHWSFVVKIKHLSARLEFYVPAYPMFTDLYEESFANNKVFHDVILRISC